MASKKVYQVGDEPTFSKVDKVYVVNQTEGGGGVADEVDWENVTDKPSSFPPTEHNLDDRYNTKEQVSAEIDFVRQQMIAGQGRVATSESDEPGYLESKVDNTTVEVEGSELVVKSMDGLTVGAADISTWLAGISDNVQTQIDDINDNLGAMTSGMHYRGRLETYAELQSSGNLNNGDLAVVLADETREGSRSMYVYNEANGIWEFIGAFTFSDRFTSLNDTPESLDGQDGKTLVARGGRVVLENVNYDDIVDKPESTITQIDDAVTKKHEHINGDLLDTYNQTNENISTAVARAHTHDNKISLDEIGDNGKGTLTYKGEEYVKKSDIITPQKKTLSAYTNKEEKIYKSDFLKFHETLSGSDIPYDTTTGIFELEIGKKYEITVNLQTEVGGFLVFRVSKSDKSDFLFPTAVMYGARSSAVYGGSGTLNLIIQPTIETGTSFAIQTSPDSSDDYTTVRRSRCSLVIKEL